MELQKGVLNIYTQHQLLDEAVAPFIKIPGHVAVSEHPHSLDWQFTLRREDGKLVRATMPGRTRNNPPKQVVIAIQDTLLAMLVAE
jgi:hypothetical protein